MPHHEIERKYLVDNLPPEVNLDAGAKYRQGYLVIDDERALTVRLRREGDVYRLAIKKGRGEVRTEVELPMSASQFDALWNEAEAISLEKTRYVLPIGALNAEVDVFEGRLEGLVMVEVEFESAAAAQAFSPPDWFGKDVTDDPRYLNQNLARHGRPV